MLGEEFVSGESPIHHIDPRVKIIGTIAFSVVVALSNGLETLVAALVMSLVPAVLARLPVKPFLARLFFANGLIFFIWIVLPFTYDGTPLFSIGPLVLSAEGLMHALRITLKCNAILIITIAALGTTPVFAIGYALDQLHVPGKLTHLMVFTYRYIHVIFREYEKLTNAMKIRGFRPDTTVHTYRSYAYLVGMLLARSYDRAERIHQAMLCRGFSGRYHSLCRYSIGGRDMLYLAAMTAAVLLLVILQWNRIL